MKRNLLIPAIALLCCAIAATAYAAMPRSRLFTAPSATELGLEVGHVAAWNQLREETIALRDAGREEARLRLQEADALLAGDSPDLATFSADIDREIDEYLARSRDLRDRKLSFYGSLSATEQASVRVALRARIERAERLRGAAQTLFQDAY